MEEVMAEQAVATKRIVWEWHCYNESGECNVIPLEGHVFAIFRHDAVDVEQEEGDAIGERPMGG